MKKLLLLSLLATSFSTFADGHHLRDFSLSDFCYQQPNVQNRDGVYYFPNQSVGITDTSICVYKDAFGQYASKGNIVRGVFDGLWTGWTRNGEIWLESYYINGKVVPIVCRDDLLEFDKDETYFDLYDEPLTGYNRCTDGEKANITTRNFPKTVTQIRKELKIKDGGSLYLFFTTNIDNQLIVIFCSKE